MLAVPAQWERKQRKRARVILATVIVNTSRQNVEPLPDSGGYESGSHDPGTDEAPGIVCSGSPGGVRSPPLRTMTTWASPCLGTSRPRSLPWQPFPSRPKLQCHSLREAVASSQTWLHRFRVRLFGLKRAHVSHGIREVILCKDKKGKVGLRVQAINQGIFVVLVQANSPAAMAGLRFGDQLLTINEEVLAGYSVDKVHTLIVKANPDRIVMAVRDRPFERTVTMHKSSTGHVGFAFRDGRIISLVKDSSATRNGLLVDHQLLEVNGQNVVGIKDPEITKIIEAAGDVITVTVIPSFVYDHMIKHTSGGMLKKLMDHSIPDI
ncbi:hypothetical protein MTO96_029374 [Rhipicephalus appendiculatus]